jgi:hypothetical protein
LERCFAAGVADGVEVDPRPRIRDALVCVTAAAH